MPREWYETRACLWVVPEVLAVLENNDIRTHFQNGNGHWHYVDLEDIPEGKIITLPKGEMITRNGSNLKWIRDPRRVWRITVYDRAGQVVSLEDRYSNNRPSRYARALAGTHRYEIEDMTGIHDIPLNNQVIWLPEYLRSEFDDKLVLGGNIDSPFGRRNIVYGFLQVGPSRYMCQWSGEKWFLFGRIPDYIQRGDDHGKHSTH